MSEGYIKEGMYEFSNLCITGKWSNSLVLQSVLQVSSLKSTRMLKVPERSVGGIWHIGCPKETLGKLHINFHIYTILESTPSLRCLQSIIMEPKRMLEVPERSLGGFWHTGCPKDASRLLHINIQIYTLINAPLSSEMLKDEKRGTDRQTDRQKDRKTDRHEQYIELLRN